MEILNWKQKNGRKSAEDASRAIASVLQSWAGGPHRRHSLVMELRCAALHCSAVDEARRRKMLRRCSVCVDALSARRQAMTRAVEMSRKTRRGASCGTIRESRRISHALTNDRYGMMMLSQMGIYFVSQNRCLSMQRSKCPEEVVSAGVQNADGST
jgi:hypothetical protein